MEIKGNSEFDRGYKIGQLILAAELVRDKKLEINYACNKLNILKDSFNLVIDSLDNPDRVVKSDTILVPVGGRPSQFTPELGDELSKIYKSMTISELSKKYEVSESTMHRWLKKAGLQKNNRKEEKL